MSDAPTISVVMAVYNGAALLPETLASLQAQSFTDWELLLVNDGSTDGGGAVARRWLCDPRIRLVDDGQNLGLATRLNQIASWARGRFLARMDADDLMAAPRLERQVAFLRAHPAVDVVGGLAYTIDAANRVYGLRGQVGLPQTLRQVVGRTPFVHPTVMARRSWCLRYPYRPDFRRAEDSELWLRTLLQSRFQVLPEPVLFYRELGVPQGAKYRQTARELQTLVRRYAAQLGWAWAARQYALIALKSGVYRVLTRLGQEPALLRRRNRRLTAAQRQEAQTMLAEICRE